MARVISAIPRQNCSSDSWPPLGDTSPSTCTITSGRTPARPMCLRARSAAMRPLSPTIWSKAAPKVRRCSAVGSQLGCFGRSTAGSSLGSTSPATRRVTRCIAVQNSSREKRPSPSPSASSQITSRSSLGRRERARKRCASAPPTVSEAVAPSTLRKTPEYLARSAGFISQGSSTLPLAAAAHAPKGALDASLEASIVVPTTARRDGRRSVVVAGCAAAALGCAARGPLLPSSCCSEGGSSDGMSSPACRQKTRCIATQNSSSLSMPAQGEGED